MWVAFFAVQSMGEEVICRGYLLRVWTRSLNLYVGLLVSSIFFALAHIGNAGFDGLGLFNTVICGAILGVVYAKTGSLWLVGGIHAGWNAAQPLFGMNVSGFQIRFAALETRFTGGNLWSGGQYGPEGSLPATVILLLFVIAMQVRGPMARNDFGVFGVDLSPKPLMPDPLKCQATEARNMDSD
jgi:membrane protease YdiL (CAAX protease family)